MALRLKYSDNNMKWYQYYCCYYSYYLGVDGDWRWEAKALPSPIQSSIYMILHTHVCQWAPNLCLSSPASEPWMLGPLHLAARAAEQELVLVPCSTVSLWFPLDLAIADVKGAASLRPSCPLILWSIIPFCWLSTFHAHLFFYSSLLVLLLFFSLRCLLPLQQIIKQQPQPCLSLPSCWSIARRTLAPAGRGSRWVSVAFSEHPSHLPSTQFIQWKGRPQSVKSKLSFLGNPVFSSSHPPPWRLGFVCVLPCLMVSFTIWNSLIFQTIKFGLAENIVAWQVAELCCILNWRLFLCTSVTACTSCCTGQPWAQRALEGRGIHAPYAPLPPFFAFENETQQRLTQWFLSKWALQVCVSCIISLHTLEEKLESQLQNVCNLVTEVNKKGWMKPFECNRMTRTVSPVQGIGSDKVPVVWRYI